MRATDPTPGPLERLEGWTVPQTRPGALEDCCLLIATYQRPTEVVKLLDALIALHNPQNPETPGEVVIVDGTPGPVVEQRIREWVHGKDLGFELRFVKSPPGLTRQRNVAIDASTREFCFYTDDDAIPLPGYFREIRRVFVEDSHRQIGGVCGFIDNEMNRPAVWRWRFRLAMGLVRKLEPMMYDPAGTGIPRNFQKPFHGVKRIEVMHGFMTFRREVFAQYRFSRYFEGYSHGEDVDMSLRVGQDWELALAGDAHIMHYPAPGGRPDLFKKGRMEVVNRYFIWSRSTMITATWDEKLRFWLDIAFVLAMNVAWMLKSPFRAEPRQHVLGFLAGIWQVISAPPVYEEPPVRRQYELAWRTLAASTGAAGSTEALACNS